MFWRFGGETGAKKKPDRRVAEEGRKVSWKWLVVPSFFFTGLSYWFLNTLSKSFWVVYIYRFFLLMRSTQEEILPPSPPGLVACRGTIMKCQSAIEIQNCGLARNNFTRWWFQIFFIFTPYLGKWSNLTNIFQVAWNHQLVQFCYEKCNAPSPEDDLTPEQLAWIERLTVTTVSTDSPGFPRQNCGWTQHPQVYLSNEYKGVHWQMVATTPRFIGFLWVNEWPIAVGRVGCCSRIPTLGWCTWDSLVSLVLGWWWVGA